MFNPAIGRNDSGSNPGIRSQSTSQEPGATWLDQIKNSPTTAESLIGSDHRTSTYQWAGSENPRHAGGSGDVVTSGESINDRSIRDERSDRVDRGHVETDRRWRREVGGDGSNGHFNSDWAGRSILDRYLTGGGDWTVENNSRWTEYMQSNAILTSDLRDRAEEAAQELFTGNADSMNIDETFSMQIENGEGIVGYQYLHGTNANVGDFERGGNASIVRNADGGATVTLNMDYRWNDVIDPNPQYSTDRWKSTIAEVVTMGQADAYDIHIGWSETTVIQLDSSGNVTSIANQE